MEEKYVYNAMQDFKEISDEELIELCKQNNGFALDFLIHKYKELVTMKISKYFIIGAEKEDIMQEGLIGLYKAIKSYNPEKQNSFKTFANMCIERQLITAIKSSNRQKHIPLNSYLSLNAAAYNDDEEDASLFETFDSHQIEDPLDTITKQEYYKDVETTIANTLSGFEKQVLNRYMRGETYIQIAQSLDTPVKSIDNAIQRIRKKALKNMEEE